MNGKSFKYRAFWLPAVVGLVLTAAAVGLAGGHAYADPGENGVGPSAGVGGGAEVISSVVPIDGPWQEFAIVGPAGTFATGCAPADPAGPGCVASSGGNSAFAGAPPWTFIAGPSGADLTVVDAFLLGDRYEVFDGGVSLGLTSVPAPSGSCGDNPVPCLADPGASKRTFTLGAGAHSITIKAVVFPFGSGAAYFRVTTGTGPSCTIAQTATHAGGNMTLSYTGNSSVPTTGAIHLIFGTTVTTVFTGPIPAGPLSSGPITFPFPASGNVGWLVTLTTPSAGILCSDYDVVNTRAAAVTSSAGLDIQVPWLGGGLTEQP